MTTKMRPIRDTIPLAEARQIIDANMTAIERVDRVPLTGCARPRPRAGRRLRRGRAAVLPRRHGRLRRARRRHVRREPSRAGALRCIEQIFTGQIAAHAVQSGQCAEIATGAPMPTGADAVVMVEETDADGAAVRIFTPVYPKQNVGRQGADIQHGQTVLRSGDVLTPSKVGVLAALGLTDVDGLRPAARGDPVDRQRDRRAWSAAGTGQIYDINRFTIAALVERHGGIAVALSHRGRHDSTTCRAPSTSASRTTCWYFPAGVRSASAT